MTLRLVLEHFGVAVAAVTGVLAARGKHIDLFGVVVLALVTAFGGGTIRDVTLDLPVFWVEDPHYVYTACATAVLAFFFVGRYGFPWSALQVADAFALALFTTIGVVKALNCGVSPSIAVIMGVITGVAGGIVRDLVVNEIPLVFRPDICLYATAAFFGATFYVVLAAWSHNRHLNMVLGTAAVLLLRLAGMRWRISLPVFMADMDAPPAEPRRDAPPRDDGPR